jgi:hypothetical protein
MLLMQIRLPGDVRSVVATRGGESWFVRGHRTVYELALAAIARGVSCTTLVLEAGREGPAEPAGLLREGRVLAPVDHPDPAHLLVSGTGLTHLGSAEARDGMHAKLAGAAANDLTDSMKMFRMGLEAGKPAPGETGMQPEWFYKSDGGGVIAPGQALISPAFAADAGEEPEVAGLYVIDNAGAPWRIGYALMNEFSDHVTERHNYLWLAHSKLRPCSFGPQLLLGDLPQDVRGRSRIRRDGEVIFDQPFLTGEANMSHSIANLERHHFKYATFRRPGDVHVHTFGTATLSFVAGVSTRAGDVFEIEAEPFGLPLVNPLVIADDEPLSIRAL